MSETQKRKSDHIEIVSKKEVSHSVTTWLEHVTLVHQAVPEVNFSEIDTSTTFLGKKLSAPIIISAMTGGTEEAAEINARLASAAEKLGIAMGVGSQRAGIENPRLRRTYEVVREVAPNAFIIANLGAPQLVRGYGVREAREAIEMVEADAIAIHLNPLQESVQPGGDLDFKGVTSKIGRLVAELEVPVIAKETGAGMSMEAALALGRVGIAAIDVAGCGGTSWAAVEYYRAEEAGDEELMKLGKAFWNWGIPTAASIVEVKAVFRKPIVASGGIRTGIDAAKSIALGASAVGLAAPLLKAALISEEEVIRQLRSFILELKTAMFLTGAGNIEELKRVPVVLTGCLREWLETRGIDVNSYARRRAGLEPRVV